MSLVNDMLRDLDRRRKESSGGAASVSLTPAPELPPGTTRRPVMLYLIAALIIGAGILAYFWLQQDGSSTTRELNIAPRLAVETITPAQDDVESAQEAADRNRDETVESTAQIESVQIAQSTQQADLVQQDGPGVQTSVDNLANEMRAPSMANEQGSATEGENLELARAEQEQLSVDPTANTTTSQSGQLSTTAELSQSPAEEVKNAAQRTPEERDLLAVQQALQLIAQNNTTEAYVVLEEEILSNRYSHQTRETYAKLLINEGNLLGALELTEAGLELSPNHAGFKKIKARLLITQGSLSEAVDLLLARAPSVDEDLEYHEILATAQLAGRDYEGALISYTGLVRQDQNQGRWWYGFAASQDSLGNSNAARQGYSRAVSLTNLSASLRRRSQERLAILSQ